MFAPYFEAGGPVMYLLFGAWVLVFAGILERISYAVLRAGRRPMRRVRALAQREERGAARAELERERKRAARGIARIDAISQLATSIDLFGMVLGLARTFFASGLHQLAAPEVLASGLAVALFTTVGGMIVFLVGQGFILFWEEWQAFCEHGLEEFFGDGRDG